MSKCDNCGLPTNTPNYAYHICVMPEHPRKKIDALEAQNAELIAALKRMVTAAHYQNNRNGALNQAMLSAEEILAKAAK